MFLLQNFLMAVSQILDIALTVYMWIVIISSLLSFVNPDPYNPLVRTIYNLTEPVYRIIRKYIPTVVYNIDFAPLIVILIIIFLKRFLVQSLIDLAYSL